MLSFLPLGVVLITVPLESTITTFSPLGLTDSAQQKYLIARIIKTITRIPPTIANSQITHAGKNWLGKSYVGTVPCTIWLFVVSLSGPNAICFLFKSKAE